ncbi:hypothetical protein ACFOY2_50210 [Nonomuraea purpurea]|uniref:DUF3558 domain-containing protein n=1 Tax=Nonomuraea purpurea TaxID=1849276 RepID=A0ABV8GT00_9ACTN
MIPRTAAFCAIAALSLVSCGTAPQTAAAQRYETSLTVLEGGGHGPQLCAVVATSLPPQCEGPDVVGWDWTKVKHEWRGGVKWGEYRVVGTWDGARLTLTEPPGPPGKPPAAREVDFTSPCPEPQGGWRAVDPARATEKTLGKAMERAMTAAEFAGGWIDNFGPEPDPSKNMDARQYVLNLKFTGDLSGREAWIREVWGGALCLSGAQRSEAALNAIQRQVESEVGDGLISASSSVTRNVLEVSVWLATDELRRAVDAKHGAGVVVFDSVLRPVR